MMMTINDDDDHDNDDDVNDVDHGDDNDHDDDDDHDDNDDGFVVNCASVVILRCRIIYQLAHQSIHHYYSLTIIWYHSA